MSVQYWGTSVPWSDRSQLFFSNSTPGASFMIQLIAPVESDYAIGVNLATSYDYGDLQFDLADPGTTPINLGNTKNDPIDVYSASVSAHYVFLGGIHLTAGAHCLKVTVTGTDAASTGNHYNAGIDFLELVPVTGATDASFTAAMNNEGIASDNSTTYGNFDLTNAASGGNLSLQALATAGITAGTTSGPGNTFSLNGATFTMPKLSSNNGNTYDNVIPDGQTIPLPAVNATDVALLVASTCGTSPTMPVTLTYSDGSTNNPMIPAVPDWLVGSSSTAVMRLQYWDQGSTPNTGRSPGLYEAILPAKPNVTLSSISLPVPPVNFLTNSGSCAASEVLHILAIGTRTVAAGPSGTTWTGSYAAPMDTVTGEANGATGDYTLREPVALSVPGSGSVRVHLSNAGSDYPVTFDAATIAAQATAGGPVTVATGAGAPVALTFGADDATSVTLPAGGDAYSNPVALPSTSGGSGEFTVSVHVAASSAVRTVPIHDTPAAVTYYAPGDQTTNTDGTPFVAANSLQGLAYLAGIDVSDTTATDGTVAVLGDQTAAGSPAGTTTTWVTDLPAALSSANPSVPLPGAIANTSSGGTPPDHWWRLNGAGLDPSTTAYDSGSSPTTNLTLDGGATWTTDNPGTGVSKGALALNGTTGYAATSGPVVTTTHSFSVSAWVNLSALPAGDAAAVAQDGSQRSGFYLGYNAQNGGWGFYFANSDTATASVTGVFTAPLLGTGAWTHLTGVYDASNGTASLYLNGKPEGSVKVTPWSATGSLTVGAGLSSGSRSDYFPGEISDVRIFSSALPASEVAAVYNDTGQSTLTTANALTAFRNDVAAEPNLRDVIVSIGADDVLQGAAAPTIESNLTSLILAIDGQNVNNQPGVGVQAFLTTIPPLNLPSGDPRESVRQQVNSWIMGGATNLCSAGGTEGINGTALGIDVACAVQQSGSTNDTNPSMLSGGLPNANYYSAIAEAIASAIALAFPPLTL